MIPAILGTDFSNIDKASTAIYFDETNNFRKLYAKHDDKLNLDDSDLFNQFLLGGLLIDRKSCKKNISKLFGKFTFQSNMKEIKLDYFKVNKSSKFEDYLKSEKLNTLLEWLLNEKHYYIHYLHVNTINFFLVVDVIESLNFSIPKNNFYETDRQHKDTLSQIAAKNLDNYIKLLIKYNIPNMNSENSPSFINELISLVNDTELDESYDDKKSCLLQLLEQNRNIQQLLFLESNPEVKDKKSTFYPNLSMFYNQLIDSFKNAELTFDNEDQIIKVIKQSNAENFNRCKFQDSEKNQFIQISDIIVGIYGKLMSFFDSNNFDYLESWISELNSIQINNLKTLFALEEKSAHLNPYLLNHIGTTDSEIKKHIDFKELFFNQHIKPSLNN